MSEEKVLCKQVVVLVGYFMVKASDRHRKNGAEYLPVIREILAEGI